METIGKLIRAIFLNDAGEVEKSTVTKIKDFLLVLFIVEHLLFGAMLYWVDDEDTSESNIEMIDD